MRPSARTSSRLAIALLLLAAWITPQPSEAIKLKTVAKGGIKPGLPEGAVILSLQVEKVDGKFPEKKGTLTAKGDKAVLICALTLKIKNSQGVEEDFTTTYELSVTATKKNQAYHLKCKDPFVFQLPADAHDVTASFSGANGSGALPTQSGLSSIATAPGAGLQAEPGQQLLLADLPDDMPEGDFDVSLSFGLASSRPVDLKLVSTAFVQCEDEIYYPVMAPLAGSMGGVQSFGLPVTDQLASFDLPLGDLPDHVNLDIICPCNDTDPPICQMTGSGTNSEGKKYITITAQDTDSGLDSIFVTLDENADVDNPPFTPETNDPVVVTATKEDAAYPSRVELKVTDICQNVTRCDPVATLVIREQGKPVVITLSLIPPQEHFIRVGNGSPGVKSLEIVVNGEKFKLNGLENGEERFLDVARAMLPANNIITLKATGQPGGEIFVVISD